MVQNPNTRVINSIDKKSLFSGSVTEATRISVSSDKKYYCIRVKVTAVNTSNKMRIYVVSKNGNTSNALPVIINNLQKLNYFAIDSVGEATIIAPIDERKDIDIIITAVANYTAGTVFELEGFSVNTPSFEYADYSYLQTGESATISADINKKFYNYAHKRGLLVKINVEAIGLSTMYFIAGNSIDEKKDPKIYDKSGFVVSGIVTSVLGFRTYYVDIESYLNFSLYFARGNSNATVSYSIEYTEQTLEEFIAHNDSIVDKRVFQSFMLVKKQNVTDAYDGYISYHSSNAKIKVSHNGDSVDINLTTLFGSTLKTTASGNSERFISQWITGTQKYNIYLFVPLANGKAYTCLIYDASAPSSITIHTLEDVNNWVECKFWEKLGTNRKIPTKVAADVDSHHRYDTTLPDSRYDYDTELASNGMIPYQGVPNLSTLATIARSAKMTCLGTYTTSGDRPCIWVTSDGGKNWVALFDFASNSLPSETISAYINTDSFAAYNNSLSLYKVVRNTPSGEDKEPSNAWEISALTISAITKGTKTIIGCIGHGLENGDLVLFTGGSSDWSQLASSSSSSHEIGDNVYYVEKIDNDSFYLREYTGSYDTQLCCRHIHSINEAPSGFIVATGEEYPYGWMMFVEQLLKDGSDNVDFITVNYTSKIKVYRLTSAASCIQRCCGVIQLTNAQNPKILYFADSSIVLRDNHYMIEGRTDLPSLSSNGIWKGELSKIDNWIDNDCIMPLVEPCIWVQKVGNVIVVRLQLGGIAVSVDNGLTWEYVANENPDFVDYCGEKDGHVCLGKGYEVIPI